MQKMRYRHFLRWIVYYCVCIQHDIDKSQMAFIELCKTLRTNSGLRAINSCLHVFWPQLCNGNICAVSCVLTPQTLEFGPTHIFTQIYAPGPLSGLDYSWWEARAPWKPLMCPFCCAFRSIQMLCYQHQTPQPVFLIRLAEQIFGWYSD